MSKFQDKRIREHLNPVRIVMTRGAVENADVLLSDKDIMRRPHNNHNVMFEKGGFILIDFGREINGSLRITTGWILGSKSAKIRVRFGESVSEAMSELGVDNSINAHFARDTELLMSAMATIEYGEEGFRFISIELLDDVKLFLQSVEAIYIHQDLAYKGDFLCDDELLNQIWKTGAYTVELNMQNYIYDGIKRDRLVWIGDMQPEVATISTVFGFDESVKRSLDFIRDNTPLTNWMCGIATYSMWWIIIHYQWYMQNGDMEYLLEQRDYMLALINKALDWIPHYKESTVNFETFVDWSAKDSEYEEAGVKSVFVMGLESAAKIAEVYGENDVEGKCLHMVESLRRESPLFEGNKQMAALTAVANIYTAEEVYDKVLSQEPAEGLSTFLGSFVIEAMARAGHIDTALDVIRKYWGGMLRLGATTFWEDFDIKWLDNAGRIDEIVPEGKHDVHREYGKHCYTQFRHSLCHGWASGPTAFLSKHVLGIHILEPGCRVIEIKPNLCGLKWVKGKYPTPLGVIEVEHFYNEKGVLESKIIVPNGISIHS